MSTQITATTELQAVNIMLSYIGEAPVSTIEDTTGTGTDVAMAKNILNETSMSVQTQGWHFNTEKDVTIALDTDGKAVLPTNAVQVEVSSPYQEVYSYTIRNGNVYDLENKTDVFTNAPIVDYVLVQQFEQLPEYARRYITTKAARRFTSRLVGATTELARMAEADEQEAHVAFEQADARAGDHNILTGNYSQYYIINRGRYRRSNR